jgi:23S rRNA U2552 (ribose-2'-O)-methylase RlmE/FtsJ
MNVALTEEYQTQKTPVQPDRDEKLLYAINKLQSQGRSAYFDVCSQVVHPHRAAGELGIGSLSSVELHECGYKAFAAYIPDLLANARLDKLVSVHLCEAPGGFIDRTSKWCKTLSIGTHSWLATSHAEGEPFSSHLLSEESGQIIADTNLLDAETTEKVRHRLSSEQVWFITGDCNEETEQTVLPLIFTQVYIGLDVLEKGGLFILKIMDFYQHGTKLLLWLLFNVFKHISIEKPKVSACCSSSKYLICCSFNKILYEKQYKQLCKEMRETHNPLMLEFPLSWSYWLTKQQNKFTKVKQAWQKKALQVCNILISEVPYLSKQNLDILLSTCWKDKNIRQFTHEFLKELNLKPGT